MSTYFLIWAGLSLPAIGLFFEKSPWAWVVCGVNIAGWLVTSRRHLARLIDRSPQLELHPNFIRSKQFANDIPWSQVRDITGRQSGAGLDQGSAEIQFHLTDGTTATLDLSTLNVGMERLYAISLQMLEANARLRDSGTVAAVDSGSSLNNGSDADDLGREIAVYTSGATPIVSLLCGIGLLIAIATRGIIADLNAQKGVPSTATVVLIVIGLVVSLPLIIMGVLHMRVRLVLFQRGLTFVGPVKSHRLRYDDIQQVSALSIQSGGNSALTVQLIPRNGSAIKLSGISGCESALAKITELRSARG
ncbi:MAG: hypothetical protein U0996_17840 [Planctomycetaceae bacterium]